MQRKKHDPAEELQDVEVIVEKSVAPQRSMAVLKPEDMTSPPMVRRAVLALAWPVIVEQVLSMLVHVVDGAMTGRLGAETVTGISLSFQPMMLAMGLFGGVSMGNSVLVARAVGAGDRRDANRVARQSLVLGVMLALFIMVPAWVFVPNILSLMGAQPDAMVHGIRYLQWSMPGLPFMLSTLIMTGSLRGAGDTRTPMLVNVAANLMNVVLNWILIWGNLGMPRMEEAGAALATSLSRVFSFFALLYFMSRQTSIIHLRWEGFKESLHLDFDLIKRILTVGLPAAMERLVMSAAGLAYTRAVSSLGTVVYAAHAISLNAETFSFTPSFGFQMAASTMVGQNLGAKQPEAAKMSAWECWKMAALTMGSIGVLFALFPISFMRIFTDDVRVFPFAYTTMRIMAFIQIPESIGFVMGGALRGAGDTRSVLYVTIAGAFVVRAGLAHFLIHSVGMGLTGAWVAMAADWIVRATLLMYRWRSDRWQAIKV